MKRTSLVFCAIACAASPAWAVNKCKGPDGKVIYQDSACSQHEVSETLKIGTRPSSPQTPTSTKRLPFKSIEISQEQASAIASTGVDIARRRLKDPDSAKFLNVRVFSFSALDRTFTMTCGDLNAKNSFGGYVGSKPFWVYDGMFTETFDHYLPGVAADWLMGGVQTACLQTGKPVGLP